MEPHVFFAVLFGAACHAGWNALLKIRLEPFSAMALVAIGSLVMALPIAPFVGIPAPASWPWLLSSVVLHIGYYVGLSEAYRAGDMGQVYPLARGTAPLMTATVSTLVLGEALGFGQWIGILVLAGGVFLMSFRGGRDIATIDRRAVYFALFTAVTICCYSVVDGSGARVSASANAYAIWLFICDGIVMIAFAYLRRGPGVFAQMIRSWRAGLIGGALSLAAYWIAIWAMTVAPIALVAALRETSVLFGAAIAVFVLKEPLRATRIAAALLIVTGLALIRLP
jgi:drug/metabolite transporter (DMT)-like permease